PGTGPGGQRRGHAPVLSRRTFSRDQTESKPVHRVIARCSIPMGGRVMTRTLLGLLLLSTTALAQDPNAVSPRDIEKAIRKGSEFLKAAPFAPDRAHPCANDLILLPLIHAEVPEANTV